MVVRTGALRPVELYNHVVRSLRASDIPVFELSSRPDKPYRFQVGSDGAPLLRVYAWNATHGGGQARAADEYRIQLTAMPTRAPGERMSIIGWSRKHGMFVGWDPRVHEGRDAYSPSLQVRESTIERAQRSGFASATRSSGDVVVAFDPRLLLDYCLHAEEIHETSEFVFPRDATDVPPHEAPTHQSEAPRAQTSVQLLRAYRAWDFRDRVLTAYDGRCAVCGLGVGVIDAAHIVPVAAPGSTDRTDNGIALCKNHHAAYDAGLMGITPELSVRVAWHKLARRENELTDTDRAWLARVDSRSLSVIPSRRDLRPSPAMLRKGLQLRGWQGPDSVT